MSARTPDFDDLVGADLPADERERLLRVHELLVAAGPPPDVARPAAPVIPLRRRRRRGVLLALAATLAVALFAAGAIVGNKTAGRSVDFTVSMTGTPAAANASASLAVYELDAGGNWPMEVRVSGLQPAKSGRPYELWLTKQGKLAVLCGSFKTDASGSATVPMNAPYRFTDFDGWVVVEEGTHAPVLRT